MAATSKGIVPWTHRKIPFTIADGHPFRDEILEAMGEFEARTGVWFSARRNEANYLNFIDVPGTSKSPLGMKSGKQDVNVNKDFVARHEIGHALGLIHEQQRSARDSFIAVQWQNVAGGQTNSAFTLDTASKALSDYDIRSVMHYPAPAKGWGGTPPEAEVWTMRWKADGNTQLGAGHHQGWEKLSDLDAAGLASLYNAVPGWSNQTHLQGWGTTHAPRCAQYKNKLWMVWKGSGDDGIWYATFDGTHWSGQTRIHGVGTSAAPAVAASSDGYLYLAWRGVGKDAGIWYSRTDGAGWSAQQKVPGVGTSHGPSLASHDGKLWMAWKGSGDEGIWFAAFNGTQWSGQTRIDGVGTSRGPALAVANGKLSLAWKGSGNDVGIWYSTFSGSWKPQQVVPGVGTSEGPSLAEYDGRLWMVWKGSGDDGIWWATHDGSAWSGQARILWVGTADSPAIAAQGGLLRMVWAGIKHDGLWTASFPLPR